MLNFEKMWGAGNEKGLRKIGDIEGNKIKYKGGLRKIGEIKPPCRCPEHDPPSMISLEPGIYEYVCPECGSRKIFTVPAIYM